MCLHSWHFFLQQGLSVQLRIASDSQQASCLSLSSARVIGVHHHLAHRYRASSLRMFLRAQLAQSWVACVTGHHPRTDYFGGRLPGNRESSVCFLPIWRILFPSYLKSHLADKTRALSVPHAHLPLTLLGPRDLCPPPRISG